MNKNQFPLIALLFRPIYLLVALVTAISLFTFNYHLMSTLPGVSDLQCQVGSGLNTNNIIFTSILGLMAGICMAGLAALLKKKLIPTSMSGSVFAGFGTIAGILTSFCTLCTFPVISIFGSSIGFGFFTDYNGYFKVLSLLFMSTALYLINRKLANQCSTCHF